jgi:hypothetical protein
LSEKGTDHPSIPCLVASCCGVQARAAEKEALVT